MTVELISFTENGGRLAAALAAGLERSGHRAACTRKGERAEEWTAAAFRRAEALIFVGAAGIAVRSVAPHLVSKARDPAVVVVDELGRFAVPILSGHLGGANDLAREIAGLLGGQAVLTTATDARGIFAFDQWARRLGCAIPDPEKIRPVASRMLAGETAAFWSQWPVAGECPSGVVPAGQEAAQVQLTIRDTPEPALKLVPRIVWAGIGCRRGVPAERLEAALRSGLEAAGLHPAALAGVCTIDRKGEEPGLLELCRRRRLPLLTYSPEELSRAEGEFTPSPFVRQVTGTDNVCERAAVLASGGPLLLKKTAGEGVTAALAAAPFAPPATLRQMSSAPVISAMAGSMKFAAPNTARHTAAPPRPKSAGPWRFAASHWSVKMVTNRAVITNSMPFTSSVSTPPSSQPSSSPTGMPARDSMSACARMTRRSCRGVVPMVFSSP